MLSPIKTEIITTDNNGYHDQLKFKLNDTGTEENKESEKGTLVLYVLLTNCPVLIAQSRSQ